MSRHRIKPGAGYVIVACLPKGPNGRALCRWCATEVTPPRKTFCSDGCVHEWKLRSQPPYARMHVWFRDRGVCAGCFVVVGTTPRWRGPWSLERYWQHGSTVAGGWFADHIVAVEEGGGECGLENLQTLCKGCHDAKTAAHVRRIAARRAAEKRRAYEANVARTLRQMDRASERRRQDRRHGRTG